MNAVWKQGRADFRNGESVMLCHHIFEDARSRGSRFPSWNDTYHHREPQGTQITRDDETTFLASLFVCCHACTKLPPKDLRMVEYIWDGAVLHVADAYMDTHGHGRQ